MMSMPLTSFCSRGHQEHLAAPVLGRHDLEPHPKAAQGEWVGL